jgi:hypothetical protein
VSDGSQTKETTGTANERGIVPSSHDKQRKADGIKHEQPQVNGIFLFKIR